MATAAIMSRTYNKTKIGLIELDVATEETHGMEVEITDSPVEKGADVSDHIRMLPKTLEISGVISNTPINLLHSEQQNLSGQDRVIAAWDAIESMLKTGEVVDVVTTLRVYENMAVQSVRVTRDAENGNVLNVSLSLREVLFAETQTKQLATVTKTQKSTKGRTGIDDKGKTATKETDDTTEEDSSALYSAFASLGG